MATTLQQVADRAGVSLATASRVLNGSTRRPRPDVTERVQRVAAELGYIPNAQAQALARASTGLIGLLVQDIADTYFSVIASGVQQVAARRGKLVLLATSSRQIAAEYAAVSAFMAHRTDGIILVGSRASRAGAEPTPETDLTALCRAYVANGGRLTVVGDPMEGFSTILARDREGSAALATELIALGHRRFAVVHGPELSASIERSEGFLSAVAADDRAALEWTVSVPLTRDGAYDAARDRLAPLARSRRRRLPLCVFAVTDAMALGVMSAARDLGLDVPGQVSVAGFADIKTLRDVSPGMTTVHVDLEAMGREAARVIIDPQAGLPDVRADFDAVPVLRESTRLD